MEFIWNKFNLNERKSQSCEKALIYTILKFHYIQTYGIYVIYILNISSISCQACEKMFIKVFIQWHNFFVLFWLKAAIFNSVSIHIELKIIQIQYIYYRCMNFFRPIRKTIIINNLPFFLKVCLWSVCIIIIKIHQKHNKQMFYVINKMHFNVNARISLSTWRWDWDWKCVKLRKNWPHCNSGGRWKQGYGRSTKRFYQKLFHIHGSR